MPHSGRQNQFIGGNALSISFYSSTSENAWAPIDNPTKYSDPNPNRIKKAEQSSQKYRIKDNRLASQSTSQRSTTSVAVNSQAHAPASNVGSSAFQLPILERESIIVPRFTDDALNRGFRGILVFELSLDEKGRVVDTRLRNPSGLNIDTEAIASARNARYVPAKDLYGRPISSKAELSFAFLGH